VKQIQIRNTGELPAAARQFISAMGGRHVFAFYGAMGAGKTTFIRAVCEALGVREAVTSPTFAIVNEYEIIDDCKSTQNIFHFDFYRIRQLQEARDIGFEDYLYSPHLCFIEWPELVEQLLPEDAVRVAIVENPADGSRMVTME